MGTPVNVCVRDPFGVRQLPAASARGTSFNPIVRMQAVTAPPIPSLPPSSVRSPEQMRALAEKGVSQAATATPIQGCGRTIRHHRGRVTSARKGRSEYNAKLIVIQGQTTSSLDFAQELFGVKTPAAAMELWTSHAKKQYETLTAPGQGARRAQPEVPPRRRADQARLEALQAGRLIVSGIITKSPGGRPGLFVPMNDRDDFGRLRARPEARK